MSARRAVCGGQREVGGGGDQIFIGLSAVSVTTYNNCIIKVRQKQVTKHSDCFGSWSQIRTILDSGASLNLFQVLVEN